VGRVGVGVVGVVVGKGAGRDGRAAVGKVDSGVKAVVKAVEGGEVERAREMAGGAVLGEATEAAGMGVATAEAAAAAVARAAARDEAETAVETAAGRAGVERAGAREVARAVAVRAVA